MPWNALEVATKIIDGEAHETETFETKSGKALISTFEAIPVCIRHALAQVIVDPEQSFT